MPPQPHESHFSHILSRNERDAVSDHRFEPVAVQSLKIRSRHQQRQRRYAESHSPQKSLLQRYTLHGHLIALIAILCAIS
jgi:hypothetical protein